MGGNVGDVEASFLRALDGLRAALGPLRVASLYRGAAISPLPQPPYLNTAVLARTGLPPDAVLALAKALERAAGRERGPRLGPRPLDVDLLLHGDRVSDRPELTLPHPRLRGRRFVLAPLAEIAPGLPLPPDGATARELLARLGGDQDLERIAWRSAPEGLAE